MDGKWTLTYFNKCGNEVLLRTENEYSWPEDFEDWLFYNPFWSEGLRIYRASIHYDTKSIFLFMTKVKEGEDNV